MWKNLKISQHICVHAAHTHTHTRCPMENEQINWTPRSELCAYAQTAATDDEKWEKRLHHHHRPDLHPCRSSSIKSILCGASWQRLIPGHRLCLYSENWLAVGINDFVWIHCGILWCRMLCITFRCRIRFLLCNKSVHVTECVFNGLKNIKCRNNKINEKNLFSYSREWHVLFLILAKIAWNFFHYDKPNIHSMNRKTATVAYTAHRLIFIFHHYYPSLLRS